MFIVQCVYEARIKWVIGADETNVLTAPEISVIEADNNNIILLIIYKKFF